MLRTIVLAIALALLSLGWSATAREAVSPSLSLAEARAVFAATGNSVGKVFANGNDRYVVRRVDSRLKRPNVFVIEVEIAPLPQVN